MSDANRSSSGLRQAASVAGHAAGVGFGRLPSAGSIAAVLVVLLGLALASPIGAVLAVGGMLPSLAALLVDRSQGRVTTLAVTGMNFAGVFPFLLRAWMSGTSHTIPISVRGAVIMYLSAACGWIVATALPSLVEKTQKTAADYRIKTLRERQRRLLEEWGPEVDERVDESETANAASGSAS